MCSDLKLYAPAGYSNIFGEYKNAICNGCGSKGLGGFFVPNTLWGLSIKESCNIHDFMYFAGESIDDKNSADRAFLNNMIRTIDANKSWRVVNYLRKNRAFIYYKIVKTFGGPAFWDKKNANDEMIVVES